MPRTPPKRRVCDARHNGVQGPMGAPAGRHISVPNNPVVETIDLTSYPSVSLQPKILLTNIVINVDSDTSFEIASPQPKKTPKQTKAARPKRHSPDIVEVGPTIQKCYPLGNCPICFDELGKNPLSSTRCGHVFCTACLQRSLDHGKQCPTCRKSLKGANSHHSLYIGIA